ncbi:alpha/beta hydrolase [Rhodobacteraceae bacterium B1Z28]|uniref:Alpha/beta hydrolase n=1 Tax=Ruegeria haliotis TaxID=2747601 RepID=A0ABX2PUE3_9RHOB|nr:alpha/beta hydrolase [Ruegeria haliotis]NVO57789.1 alpha/beta hydrolase [Ruegeria haliotis]
MTPLILLPGMMCDARLFASQTEALSSERPVFVPTLSGSNTMERLATEVLKNAPERFALGGLSMGGIAAMEVLRQAPDRVAGLALLDTNPSAETEEIQARRGPQMKRARTGQLDSVMRDEMKPNYLSDGENRAAILELCMNMALELGPDVFCEQSIALRDRPDQSETLRHFNKPALVLCGREDKLCPISRHELMHKLLPRSELVIIDGAGHLPTLEKPHETTHALRRWLKEIDDER